MPDPILPRYPVYVPSKGRADRCLTAKFLATDGVPFRLVVEPQEYDAYAACFGEDRVLTLPFANLGQGSIPARNWIMEHSIAGGHARHWQLDDNCWRIRRLWNNQRYPCKAGVALSAAEDFVDRYENVAVAGLNYTMFVVTGPNARRIPPFQLNCHVYSCTLVLNSIPHRWRGRYNEDTDLCLQVLADGWCTVLVNAFMIDKLRTMKMKGGNTDAVYQAEDSRLKMSRALERNWPGVVQTKRRFGRPQHHVAHDWKKFDTPLKLKPGAVVPDGADDYGLVLRQATDADKLHQRRRKKE